MRNKITRYGIFNQGNRLSCLYTQKILKRELTIKRVSSGENGMNMYSLTNDLTQSGNYKKDPNSKPHEPNVLYHNASMQQFYSQLKPDSFYILVEKGIAESSHVIDGGHITSFITDHSGKPIKELTVSLRPGKVVKEKIGNDEKSVRLSFTYQHLNAANTEVFTRQVRYVKFATLDDELKKIFDQAGSCVNSERLYLIELPLHTLPFSIDDHISRTEYLFKALTYKWFILLDGSVNGIQFKALNCVTGFYSRHLLKSTTSNPSPQMAAWSYMSHVYGEIMRDKFIDNTRLKDMRNAFERHFDDMLEESSKEELAALQMD
jgi:hypothetical protein